MRAPSHVSLLLCTGLAACGGSKPSTAAPEATATAEATSAPSASAEPAVSATASADSGKPAASKGIPTSCASTVDGYCLPDARFVKKLCENQYPTVALVMFSKNMPWNCPDCSPSGNDTSAS